MKNNSTLYKWLIITFIALYAGTAFVSFYHSITFFNIANTIWLSVILSLIAELGQASVLFSLLLTKNKNNWLAWTIMFLLTSLQVVGNVVSSYKYISVTNAIDFTYFQKSVLFWVSNTNADMFRVIIAWITGGILPVIALSMTALVADNLKLKEEERDEKAGSDDTSDDSDSVSNVADNVGETPIIGVIDEPAVNDVSPEQQAEKLEQTAPKKPVVNKKPRPSRAKKNIGIKVKKNVSKAVKDLDSIKKISRGTELIQTLQDNELRESNGLYETEKESDQTSPDTSKNVNDEADIGSPGSTEEILPDNVVSTISVDGKVVDRNYK